jgi:hypothetical protein
MAGIFLTVPAGLVERHEGVLVLVFAPGSLRSNCAWRDSRSICVSTLNTASGPQLGGDRGLPAASQAITSPMNCRATDPVAGNLWAENLNLIIKGLVTTGDMLTANRE